MKRKYEKPTMEEIALDIVVMFEQATSDVPEKPNVVFESKENDFSFSDNIEEDEYNEEEE